MKATHSLMAASALALVSACGPVSNSDSTEEATQQAPEVGNLHLACRGAARGELAVIAIRDLFDAQHSFLVDCARKAHRVEGQEFCDELMVLPPGTYEVVVQSPDEDCVAERERYQAIVRPNQTTEMVVQLVCGADNGALDVVVVASHRPVIEEIDFWFGCHKPANKFVCARGRDVTVRARLSDADTPCSQLCAKWLAGGSGLVLETAVQPRQVEGECVAEVTIDAARSPIGAHPLTLKVADGGCRDTTTTSLSFPVHVIECEEAPCP